MLNIVIPMAGLGSRFKNAGYIEPKPFIKFNSKMMIEHVLDGLKYPNAHYTLIIQKEFEEKYLSELESLSEKYKVAFLCVDGLTQGAAATALASYPIINNDLPVVFADSDNIFDNESFISFVDDCCSRQLDGSLLTFYSSENCFSYARINSKKILLETREKEVISDHAIAGVYMYTKGSDFVKCAIDMLIYGDKTKNEFYMSNTYNYAVRKGLKIGIHDIKESDFHCVGTPELLEKYISLS